jgi:hypothetical protein
MENLPFTILQITSESKGVGLQLYLAHTTSGIIIVRTKNKSTSTVCQKKTQHQYAFFEPSLKMSTKSKQKVHKKRMFRLLRHAGR